MVYLNPGKHQPNFIVKFVTSPSVPTSTINDKVPFHFAAYPTRF